MSNEKFRMNLTSIYCIENVLVVRISNLAPERLDDLPHENKNGHYMNSFLFSVVKTSIGFPN